MQELAAITVLAGAVVFEVNADFSFIVLIEEVLMSKLPLVVGEGTLLYQRATD